MDLLKAAVSPVTTVGSILRGFPAVHLSHPQRSCGLNQSKGGTRVGGDHSKTMNSGGRRMEERKSKAL